jgi:glyoxylase-like metal-dependent hydrolase (beta-lactamase superfamily II)
MAAGGAVRAQRGQELYLVATHIHPEHDLGAGGFPARTKMVRSKEQEADIQETGLSTARIFANFSPVIGELLQGAEFRKADISFEREHVVDLGGVRALRDQLQGRCNRNQMASAVRAAYNEAQ